MLITRETDYALRILSTLALGRQFTAGELCEQELIPRQFGYKILKKLDRGGLIEITRGKNGGCRLACDLGQTTLYHLMNVIGEDLRVSCCMVPDYECRRRQKRNGCCPINERFVSLQKSLNRELKLCTLSELVKEVGPDGRR